MANPANTVLRLIVGRHARRPASPLLAGLPAVETKSLIIGESAPPEQLAAIEEALVSALGSTGVIHLRTMHLGPEELLARAASS